MLGQIALGLVLSGAIAALAYWRKSLSASGVVGALITGTALFGFGGLPAGILLIAFFVSASYLSHYKKQQKQDVSEEFSKGTQRDIWQALANAGVASAFAVAYAFVPEGWVWAAIVGALATANADTWATEIGVLAAQTPRLITNWQLVPVGTSGGITRTGTLASLGAAAFIAAIAAIFTGVWSGVLAAVALVVIGSLAGVLGGLFDSLLGATIQATFYCDTCQKETERHPLHRCGSETRQIRGLRWLDNDVVNFAATLVGALAAAGLWLVSGL